MNRGIRNTFLILGVISFLATAVGITLYLHLAHTKEPARHDVAHCSICQQLLICKKKYTAEIEPAEVEIDRVGQLVSVCPEILSYQTAPSPFHAMPAPSPHADRTYNAIDTAHRPPLCAMRLSGQSRIRTISRLFQRG